MEEQHKLGHWLEQRCHREHLSLRQAAAKTGVIIIVCLGLLVPPFTVLANETPYQTITGDGYYNAWGDIALLSNGNLFTVYRKGETHTSRESVIAGRISTDNVPTWDGEFNLYSGSLANIKAVYCSVIGDGTAYVSFWVMGENNVAILEGKGMYLLKSVDDGETWSEPIQVSTSATYEAVAPSRVTELPDGRLLLSYCERDQSRPYQSVRLLTSTDGGVTWGNDIVIADGPADQVDYQESSLTYLGDGELVVFIRHDNTQEYFYMTRSLDYGATWSKPVVTFSGTGRPSVSRLTDGSLLAVYRAYSNHLSVYRASQDKGASWSPEYMVDGEPGCNEYGGSVSERGSDNSTIVYLLYFLELSATRSDARLKVYNNGFDMVANDLSITIPAPAAPSNNTPASSDSGGGGGGDRNAIGTPITITATADPNKYLVIMDIGGGIRIQRFMTREEMGFDTAQPVETLEGFIEQYGMSEKAALETAKRYKADLNSQEFKNLSVVDRMNLWLLVSEYLAISN